MRDPLRPAEIQTSISLPDEEFPMGKCFVDTEVREEGNGPWVPMHTDGPNLYRLVSIMLNVSAGKCCPARLSTHLSFTILRCIMVMFDTYVILGVM